MGRDLDKEIRKLRREHKNIGDAIAVFERLEALRDKPSRKAGSPKSATLIQMKRKARPKIDSHGNARHRVSIRRIDSTAKKTRDLQSRFGNALTTRRDRQHFDGSPLLAQNKRPSQMSNQNTSASQYDRMFRTTY